MAPNRRERRLVQIGPPDKPESDLGLVSQPSGEVLPPQNYWFPKDIPFLKRPGVRVVGSGLFTVVLAGWLIQNFLQLRGYVNITASRIDLVLIVVCVTGCVWIWARNTRKRMLLVPVILTILVVASAIGADRMTLPNNPTPQPSPSASSSSSTSAAHQPANASPDKPTCASAKSQGGKEKDDAKKPSSHSPHGRASSLPVAGQASGNARWESHNDTVNGQIQASGSRSN